MVSLVSMEIEDVISLIAISNPPVNALSVGVRKELLKSIEKADNDPTVKAIVIYGKGKHFIAGADIREFNSSPQKPYLPDVIARIEACKKPVIASLSGAVLGGGLEVAMGAHYRVALPSARLGLTEVSLGLIPGAGGTQRLPRLVGIDKALEMITKGQQLSAQQAIEISLIDTILDCKTSRDSGLEFAHSILNQALPVRPTSEIKISAIPDSQLLIWRQRIEKSTKGQLASLKSFEAVVASLTNSFQQGQKLERDIFLELRNSVQQAALSHVFFAERSCSKLTELQNTSKREIKKVGIIGGGTMGVGIAANCLLNGLQVILIEQNKQRAIKAYDKVETILSDSVKRGKIDDENKTSLLSKAFNTDTDYSILAQADLVIEAAFENLDVKRDIFTKLDKYCRKGCILASNTSYLDINIIAQYTKRPEDVIGLHFFSPAHIMKLLEIVVADKTALNVTASAFSFAQKLGKFGVRSGVCDGFIGNRIMQNYRAAADAIVMAGATPYEVDAAIQKFGFSMGPYAISDLAGLDIAWSVRKRKLAENPKLKNSHFADRLCELGWFGRKSGRGYYLYSDGNRTGKPDQQVIEIIKAERKEKDIQPQCFSEKEIVERYMAAMINEACFILEEGIANQPLDIDVILINGYGFPRWLGGPMFYADNLGLKTILDNIRKYQKADSQFWQAAPLLIHLVKHGLTFKNLNELNNQ